MLLTITFIVVFIPAIFSQTPHHYKNLVLEGAGIRGFAYTGAFQVLDGLQLLSSIERVGGTSAGAIQAMLLAVGYTPEEMIALTAHVPLKQFNDGAWFFGTGMKRLRKQFGWYKGDKFLLWIEQLIAAKTGDGNITFGQLHQQRQAKGYKDLFITGTDLTYQCLRIFSHEGYPNMRIKDAVRISLSIPFYYKAIWMDDDGKVYDKAQTNQQLHVMVDGGLLSNYPLFLFDSSKYTSGDTNTVNRTMQNTETLGLLMEMPEQIAYNLQRNGHYPFAINTMNDYLKAVYHTLIDKANPEAGDMHAMRRTITIDNLNLSPRVRKLSPQIIAALLQSGREGVRSFFEQELIEY